MSADAVASNAVEVAERDATTQFRAALRTVLAPPDVRPSAGDVVWIDGDSELLVRPGQARLVLRPGLVLAGIPVSTDQTGDVEIAVPFAVGSPGLLMATESTPRGPASIVARWGESLVAVAWEALLAVTTTTANGGSDAVAAAGVPVALRVTPGSLVVDVDRAPAAELI